MSPKRANTFSADLPKPDLLLIDGGKGQLGAALAGLEERGAHIPAVGLAKRLEEITCSCYQHFTKMRAGTACSTSSPVLRAGLLAYKVLLPSDMP